MMIMLTTDTICVFPPAFSCTALRGTEAAMGKQEKNDDQMWPMPSAKNSYKGKADVIICLYV